MTSLHSLWLVFELHQSYFMILDIVVGVILFLSMLVAWFRGFIREVLTILGLVGACLAALYGAAYITPTLYEWMAGSKPEGAKLFDMIPYNYVAIGSAYLLIFVIVFAALSLFTHWLSKTAKESGLGALDRSLGVLFGLLRALVLIGLMFVPVNALFDEEEKESWFSDSKTYVYVDYTARLIAAAIPDGNPLNREEHQKKDQKEIPEKRNDVLNLLGDRSGAKKETEKEKAPQQHSPQDDTPAMGGEDQQNKGYGERSRDMLETLIDRQSQQ